MLDERLINYVQNAIPELQELQVKVGGIRLNVGSYELVNALLIYNNVFDETNKSLAIFHLKDDLLDVWLLVCLGLSAYKDSILKNSRLSIGDFKKGELIEYKGRILLYNGIYISPIDKIERFQLVFGDDYVISPTTENIPLRYFHELSKYTGQKTKPDLSTSKPNRKNVANSLQSLLKLRDQKGGFSGYSTFLISSESSRLVDILREVQVNETPFFEMFPSVRCTPENRQRLGRDNIKRAFMFYFVSGLSRADDILREEPHIRTLFVDARGKSLKDGTLLASIRSQYNLEDIYLLQALERMDSINKLDRGLGYGIWLWDKSDFSSTTIQDFSEERAVIPNNEFTELVGRHNAIPKQLSRYEDVPFEIPYPEGFSLDRHDLVQTLIRKMFSLSNDYGNADMLNFSIHAAGVANRIFQSPLSTGEIDSVMKDTGRKTFSEESDSLKERLHMFSYGAVPEDFITSVKEFISLLETASNAFNSFHGKQGAILSVIQKYPVRRICILVNSKYAPMLEKLQTKIADTVTSSMHGARPDILVTDSLVQATARRDVIIWTYKPPYREYLMLEPSVQGNVMLLYPLQKKEYDTSVAANLHRFERYMKSAYRAALLKVDVGMLQEKIIPTIQQEDPQLDFDLEQLLSDTMEKAAAYYHGSGRADLVEARMVLFTNGMRALFQPGNKIKVVDLDSETVETKTVGNLSEYDDVAFLKDSKRTVFEELVEYYQHKPEVIELIKMSELWRTALVTYKKEQMLHPAVLKRILDGAGLVRHPVTIDAWLDGSTICPVEDDYAAVDIIARVTRNDELSKNLVEVKNAARKIHALRIKIGRYLARRLTQSYISPESLIDDPVLRNKLDEVSSHVRIVRVNKIADDTVRVPLEMTNKLLAEEDM